MDRIWTFIATMTYRDWIVVVGLIVLPLSALNAFLGLRSRYLDWQGQQSKAQFKKRLRQLSKQVLLIDQYRKEPQVLALRLLDDASTILVIFLASVALCLCGWLLRSLNPPGTGLFVISIATALMFMDFLFAIQLSRLISRVRRPEAFAHQVYGFLFNGKIKGLLAKHGELVESILTSDTFNTIQNGTDYVGSIRD